MEEISPKEEGSSSSSGMGLAKQVVQVEEFIFCDPVTNHSPSTSIEVVYLVRGVGGVMKTLKKAIENLSLEKKEHWGQKLVYNTGDSQIPLKPIHDLMN